MPAKCVVPRLMSDVTMHLLQESSIAMLWFSVNINYLAHNYFTQSIIMLSVSSISQKFASYCLTEPGK